MSLESNAVTLEVLTNEVKALEAQCKEHCFIINNNAPMDTGTINLENYNDRELNYIESLSKNIENEETPIIAVSNATTSQFLNELIEKIGHVEELTAFTRGAVLDVEKENDRLRASIKVVKEAKSRPWAPRRKLLPEHLKAAKQRFQEMKAEVQGLIKSLFPDNGDDMTALLGKLMRLGLDEKSDGYVEITPDNYHLIELLKDKNVVTPNPDNNAQIKIAYSQEQ